MGQPDSLVSYGILNERSDYRVHVCFGEKSIYFFSTAAARNACLSGRFQQRNAYQPGVRGVTAVGYLVPPMCISGIARLPIPRGCDANVSPDNTTSVKGQKATQVVVDMLRSGALHIPTLATEVVQQEVQIQGIDIIAVTPQVSIEVKCDFRGGLHGTGFLYLQIAERNPLKAK